MKSLGFMGFNSGKSHKAGDEDRLSMLTDDVLLSILERVDIKVAVRTSILSTRWKHLPWLLRELTIDVKDFLPVPRPNPITAEHMDKAMASLTKATWSFLAAPWSKTTISRLQLKLYLVNNCSDAIGPLASQAIDCGTLKDLDLAILEEKEPDDCDDEDMLQQGRYVDGFFSAYSSMLHCLTRLSLYNVCFAEWDMNHLLFDCCKQLRHLYLSNCDSAELAWKIDAPDSNLCVLELDICFLVKLEVLHLPKLEWLRWEAWICPNAPLSLGVVPSLKELYLLCGATVYFQGFKLSEVLSNTTSIQNLTLSFQGEKLWMQPEGRELCSAFNKLRKLSLHDISAEFDLLWTTVLLEAAPSVEIFDVEIWEHPCIVENEARRRTFGKRTNPSWKAAEFTNHKEWLLKEVQVVGFSPMEQQITFIKAMMKRAPNLQTIVLKDHQRCEDCEKIGALPRSERLPADRVFPEGKDEQEMIVNQLTRDMNNSHVRIVFGK